MNKIKNNKIKNITILILSIFAIINININILSASGLVKKENTKIKDISLKESNNR
jgi:hypothetical protein